MSRSNSDSRSNPSVSRRSFLQKSTLGSAAAATGLAALPGLTGCTTAEDSNLQIATFETDATPQKGDKITYGIAKAIDDPLSCKGIVILSNEAPIVLCALDWIGIGNDGQTFWKWHLARAAGTSPDRVAVHALHQHEAPQCDFSAKQMLLGFGVEGGGFEEDWGREVVHNAANALRESLQDPQPVTHVGRGKAKVEKVASNRQLLGEDGKILAVRYSSGGNDRIRALPEGLIDPNCYMISFWNNDTPLAKLSYYACHPQSYYGDRHVTCDFVGLARNKREEESGVFQIHFNGAGGNITAGKYNQNNHESRIALTNRLATGMSRAFENTSREAVTADDVGWNLEHVLLPLADHLNKENVVKEMQEEPSFGTAKSLAWIHRCQMEDGIDITALKLGSARVLHMPAELFIEYQLSAATMRPDLFVTTAAYGDYAPGYIGSEAAYPKGGYEVSERASDVAPSVEHVLTPAMRTVLEAEEDAGRTPSDFTLNDKPLISSDVPKEDRPIR